MFIQNSVIMGVNIKELPAILAFCLLVGVSVLIYMFTDLPLVWVFLWLGALGWLILHFYTTKIQKEIDEKNKDVIFDIDPPSEIIKKQDFSPPRQAKIIIEGKMPQLVNVHQKIVTRENVFIGYRKQNNEDGVCLENQIEYM